VLGFDIGSERVRREALERARDSGLPALSGRITLIQDSTSAPVPSLTVLAPVYRFGMPAGTASDRRQALIGLVAAVVRAPGLVGGVLGGIRGVDVEVFDVLEVRAGAVLYDADSILHGLGGAPTPRFTRTETIRIAGRPWTLFLSSQPGFERRAARPGPALLLLGGLAPSLAVCLALRSQFLAGERAEVLASRMTAELREAQTSLEQDVAERRRVEAALRESEARYRTLLENTPVGIYVDVGGRFVYANRELVRILGAASSAEVLGRAVLPHIAPPFRTAVAERMASGRAEATLSRELQLVGLGWQADRRRGLGRSDGLRWSAGHAGQGPRHLRPQGSRAARASLEAQLRQAQKMEAIGTFAGGIAHDFNNILGAIVGYTELAMADAGDNPAVQESLAEVDKASRRPRDLVRQILAEDAPSVLADPGQVHQVLMNLATNALHAMLPAGGTLTLREAVVDLSGTASPPTLGLTARPYVRLSIADTGKGIDPGVLDRIFEPFFTTKDPGEGTGLGLAVVHGIMKSHEGAVTVKSCPGEGTVFDLYFPACSSASVIESRPQPIRRRLSPPFGQRLEDSTSCLLI
jgi:signal transduction histidine kinase